MDKHTEYIIQKVAAIKLVRNYAEELIAVSDEPLRYFMYLYDKGEFDKGDSLFTARIILRMQVQQQQVDVLDTHVIIKEDENSDLILMT
jgi:hypothetical protein